MTDARSKMMGWQSNAMPWVWRLATAVLVGALLLLPALASEYTIDRANTVAFYVVLALSFYVVYGWTAQLSLAVVGFAGLGAHLSAAFTVNVELNFWLSMVLSMIATGIVAYVLGFAVSRIRGIYLAIATLAFSEIMTRGFRLMDFLGGPTGVVGIPRVRIAGLEFGSPGSYWYLFLGVVVVLVVGVRFFESTRVGQALRALGQGEEGAAALGIGVTHGRALAFALSSIIAAAAGGLWAGYLQFAGPGFFTLQLQIVNVASVILGGVTHVAGPVLGGALFGLVPPIASAFEVIGPYISPLALLVVLVLLPKGLVSLFRFDKARLASSGGARVSAEERGEPTDVIGISRRNGGQPAALEVTDVTKRFGGLRVLEGVTFAIDDEHLTGLIGPNGAGKTTLFNIMTGFDVANGGHVRWHQRDLVGRQPHDVARRGIIRVFQIPKLFEEMTVLDNVTLGSYRLFDSNGFQCAFATPNAWRDRKTMRYRAIDALERVGISEYAGAQVQGLPFGIKRLVEIARATAAEPSILLLDEPAAGLTGEEVELLGRRLRDLSESGIRILLVEHNVRFVASIVERLLVLANGRLIYDGEPDGIWTNDVVTRAYLGSLGSMSPSGHEGEAEEASTHSGTQMDIGKGLP